MTYFKRFFLQNIPHKIQDQHKQVTLNFFFSIFSPKYSSKLFSWMNSFNLGYFFKNTPLSTRPTYPGKFDLFFFLIFFLTILPKSGYCFSTVLVNQMTKLIFQRVIWRAREHIDITWSLFAIVANTLRYDILRTCGALYNT